jgi:peptide deformylase
MGTGLQLLTLPDELLDHPAHALRAPAREIAEQELGSPRLTSLVRALFAAMYDAPDAVGLAAPMLGVADKIIVMDVDDAPLALLNPVVIARSGELEDDVEANLCLPQWSASVPRATEVTVRFRDLRGRHCQLTASGWVARVVEHEIEILDGRLFLDDLPAGARAPERPARQPPPLSIATLPPHLLALESSVLRRPARALGPEELGSEQLQWLVRELFALQHHLGGVGLAAPQVGLSLRLAVVDDGEQEPLILLNPELLSVSSEEEQDVEGCLSIPGYEGFVSRPRRITLRTHALDGTPQLLTLDGHLARVVQHELDHLDGVLYPDRMAPGEKLEAVDGETLAERAIQALTSEEPGEAQAAA